MNMTMKKFSATITQGLARSSSALSQSSTTVSTPSFAPPGRLGTLQGLRGVHSFPASSGGDLEAVTPVRNLINSLAPGPPIPPGVQSHAPWFTPPPGPQSHPSTPFLSTDFGATTPGNAIAKRTSTVAFESPDIIASDPDTALVAARQARKAAHNAKRRRYKHYAENAALQKVLRNTGRLLQVHFATVCPFPDMEQKDRAVTDKFSEALRIHGYDNDWYTLTNEDEKLLLGEDSSVRSRVRKAAVANVPKAYGLHKTPRGPQVMENRDRVAFLLEDSRFHCKSPLDKLGRFQHDVIAEIIHDVWFSHPTALGCLYQSSFNPIPSSVLSLVLTVVRHVLLMYKDGKMHDNDFTAASWVQYDEYLTAVEQFDSGEMEKVWFRYRQNLFKDGLQFARAVPEEAEREATIQLAQADEMQRELAALQATLAHETESDDAPVAEEVLDLAL
ncbi:hypothetical protein B0H21DRAFT_820392 [Amylocystis lapponica]|nr:hypothetical protein B0H21DRAFT_820392 [Amylocystis lapponica]